MGRTIGKFAMGIRTVRDDAGPISFHHAFMRHLLSVIEIWVLTAYPPWSARWSAPRASGSVTSSPAPTWCATGSGSGCRCPVQMPPHLAHWAARADIAPLPDSLAVALRQLLGRTGTLSPQARHLLVTDIVAQVQQHVSPPPPPGTHPEDFLAAVAAERRRRDEHRLWREADLRWRLTQMARQIWATPGRPARARIASGRPDLRDRDAHHRRQQAQSAGGHPGHEVVTGPLPDPAGVRRCDPGARPCARRTPTRRRRRTSPARSGPGTAQRWAAPWRPSPARRRR